MSEIHHDKIQELKVRAEYFEDLVFTLRSRFDVLDRERASLKQQLAKAKCERDEWRSRCESLESTWLSAQVEAAAMREALEEDARNFEAVDAYYYSGDVARIRKVLHSSSAGKDLLERKRQAESIIKRFAEFDHMLIRKAVCKECGESPCKGDDKVLCVYKDLIADIDAFLKRGENDA